MSSEYGSVLQDRIRSRRQRIASAQAKIDALQAPDRPSEPTRGEQAAYDAELRDYKARKDDLTREIRDAENDIEAAESQIGSETAKVRAESSKAQADKVKEQASARSQAGTQSRSDRSAGLATKREDRIADAADAKAGQSASQQAAKAARAGEYAWGPDGIPYGIYDDDGVLRLLSDKEQNRAISMIKSGAITRTRTVPGKAEYPGQTPEPTTVQETATIPGGGGVNLGGGGSGGGGGGSGRSARWPEEITQDQQQIEENDLDIQKKRRDLLGPATAALQNHIGLIDQVEKMVASGQLQPDKATEYVSASERNYQAALRGTTVADETESLRTENRARRSTGTTLINQRLSSGASLAASLQNAAFGSGVMMPVGQSTMGYSPSALALELTNELGGGREVGDFAKKLLMESGM